MADFERGKCDYKLSRRSYIFLSSFMDANNNHDLFQCCGSGSRSSRIHFVKLEQLHETMDLIQYGYIKNLTNYKNIMLFFLKSPLWLIFTDPQIQIQIKKKWIHNTDLFAEKNRYFCLFFNLRWPMNDSSLCTPPCTCLPLQSPQN